ncbi:MAG: hypothetical protein RL616_633 [Verrucomicrobiota bacterium]
MKTNTTPIWFVLAAALAAGIWFFEKHWSPAAPVSSGLLAGLRASDVTAIEIIPAGERKISLIRTNKNWRLLEPVAYPAQNAAVESLVAALEKLSPALRLSAAEMQSHKNADAEFGFENPQFTLDVSAGGQSWHLRVGSKTAPGDGVYVRLIGGAGAFVTGVDWLQFLPRDSAAWRDTALVSASGAVDWLVISNGVKVIELRADATNHSWRMIRPLAARADGAFISTAIQQLRSARAARFVTDDPKADLATYGLAPAELDVWLGQGSNVLDAVHLGKNSPENPAQIFARREGWNSVITAAKEPLVPWRGGVNDFRDPHLLNFTAPVTAIDVHAENPYTLQRLGTNEWTVAGEKFPVDAANVQLFQNLLRNLSASEFVKDVVTATDLEGFGLATNARSITLHFADGTTNALLFGAGDTNRVLVKRSDEDFVYGLSLADADSLPDNAWLFRERQLWNFSLTNLAQITLHQGGRTRQVIRTGVNHWALAAGSQGIADPVGLEETARAFSTLAVEHWAGKNFTAPEKFGFDTNSLQVNLELKSGEKFTVDFGAELRGQTALAAVTLDGERWAFVFPAAFYPLVSTYLTVPPGAP